jgi:hypothetical protein
MDNDRHREERRTEGRKIENFMCLKTSCSQLVVPVVRYSRTPGKVEACFMLLQDTNRPNKT